MKVGVSMYSYVRAVQDGRMDISGFVREAARIGADGVELLDFFYKDAESERAMALATLNEVGLTCGVFSVGNNFALPSAEERRKQGERIRFGVDEATAYGAGVVRVFAGNLGEGIELDSARGWIVDGLREAANYAHDRGARLALENHGQLAGRGDQVRQIVEDVRQRCGHAALGANPDTGNFLLVDQSGDEGVREVADIAYMVHFKDFREAAGGHYKSLNGRGFQGTVIGEGEVDLPACVSVLREAVFDGWLNLEYEGEGDPLVDVPLSLANTRALLS